MPNSSYPPAEVEVFEREAAVGDGRPAEGRAGRRRIESPRHAHFRRPFRSGGRVADPRAATYLGAGPFGLEGSGFRANFEQRVAPALQPIQSTAFNLSLLNLFDSVPICPR
jgi:hypothetical protein